MRPSLALGFASLLLVTQPALAQGGIGPGVPPPSTPPPVQSIAFGVHKITLGMPQDEVLKLVGESYRVERETKDVWWVNENSGGTIGRLYFRGQVLDQVYRDWEIVEPDAGPAVVTMQTALAAFAQMIPGDPKDCTVESDRYAEMKGVAVSCGRMLVQLFISSNEGEPDRVFVHMNLGSHVDRPQDGPVASPAPGPAGKTQK